MDRSNGTPFSEFIILGFSDLPHLQTLLFAIFFAIYTLTLFANISIILVTCLDTRLHKPMYLFIGNLSFLDICYTSTTLPKMLQTLLSEMKTISYAGCVVQLYFFVSFLGAESMLLAAMSYDRYAAICNPLRYSTIMSQRACQCLASSAWTSGLLNSALHTAITFRLPFCSSNKINYFFCDIPPLLSLACGDTSINEAVILAVSMLIGWAPLMCIIVSYVFIISTVLKIRSTDGRQKAFSTCASHLAVVLLYYGSAIFTYVRPVSSYSQSKDHLVSVLYSFVTPMLNPLIYTFKNQEVKLSLRRFFSKPHPFLLSEH
ncbi:olfactory receptor 5V1-like [Ambystoma mexicanum]|uniref:olfactory receptor 5V1-like n=1 Tax=Ambystoma mexicanum TaxID=8296 RepID=UPI0037E8232C